MAALQVAQEDGEGCATVSRGMMVMAALQVAEG